MALGKILYTNYIFAFQTAGLVLLVAMIGAIVLTHRARPRSRHQVIATQTARTPQMALMLVDPLPGAGISESDILRPLPDAAPEPAVPAQHGGH